MSSMSAAPATSANLGADLKSSGSSNAAAKPKPCCVCKDEKAARDECMLFSNSDNAQEDCKDMVSKYKSCMAGFGFNI
ncbi:cytochrome c oxidase assembly protein subunit 17 [Diplodia corticola]|uniref:Cytochrome c oxidase assembly protein subunit 17 n=1 Tax=Diplodia corticola TaxID=236234 RepID=A0A1J9S1B3_9PEZI|nr:cytochrome c oxidase assembly protein subunit 17 [Diplodia corticola]OJD33812.1 cytochrome c oxidase assembly protein subunit 17 [Diplodia corticola]